MMENLILLKDVTAPGVTENLGAGLQNIRGSEGLSWSKRILKTLKASFNAPFLSDWDNQTCGLLWKEWGKL